MHLLLSNDDGIDAVGLAALGEALEGLGTLWTVAPARERSAVGHGLTMHEPLRLHEVGERRYATSGLPADCVYMAVHHVLPEPPALVVSGINHGSNLANDVFYSGTVAAAMEAVLHGLPAIALSMHRLDDGAWQWETARHVARRVVEAALRQPPAPRTMWNVNIPNVPLADLTGISSTTLGERRYHPLVRMRQDPRGREYFWIGGSHQGFGEEPGTDVVAIQEGWATVTPLLADLTDHQGLDALRSWTDR